MGLTFRRTVAALDSAEVTAVSRRPDAAPQLRGEGAAAVADVAGLFDLVLDNIGGRALAAVVGKAVPGGTVVLAGGDRSRSPAVRSPRSSTRASNRRSSAGRIS